MTSTLFKKVDYSLSKLIHDIDNGEIGLPDIQRPFVWTAAQVRDLFDSMYKGFPVGFFLFWSNEHVADAATMTDPEFVSDISQIWNSGKNLYELENLPGRHCYPL